MILDLRYMKKIFYYVILGLCIGLAGCSDWLDVRPRNEMKENDLYRTADGFRQVLSGVYIELADANLFGKNMTMTFPEYLAQHWKVEANKLSGYLGAYDYKNAEVETLIAGIWKGYYNALAHLNNLLANIESNGTLLTDVDYNLIRGEALGLRGFLHLELLRVFGPVPAEATGGELAIPYVTELTKESDLLLSNTYDKVMEGILKDLNAAEGLLAEDPFLKYSYEFLNNPGLQVNRLELEDLFYYYRQNRFNIFAVKAAKARCYLWLGDRKKAHSCAREVIDAVGADGGPVFRLGVESDLSALGKENRTFTREHIFSVYNSRLQDVVDGLFFTYGGLTKESRYTDNADCYASTVSPNDIRNKEDRFWDNEVYSQGSYRIYKKYRQNVSDEFKRVVPVMRLAEMYLIAMEATDNDSEAKELFHTFRVSRNMDAGVEDDFDPDVQIEREYRKEFYAEGQMFWYYKRTNAAQLKWGVARAITMDASKYVIPKPDSQNVFE